MSDGLGVARRRVRRAAFCFALTSVGLLAGPAHLRAQEPVPRSSLGRDIPVFMPALGDPVRHDPAVQNPTGALSLREALALSLMQNPRLAAFGWEMRAREARALQAGRGPNPAAGVLIEDYGARQFAGGGVNEPVQPQATIQLSQLIELGGKRASRERLATVERDLAAWDYEAARIETLTETTRAFTDVLAAQAMVSQMDEATGLVRQVRDTVAQRVTAGDVSPIEETRADVTLSTISIEASRARRQLAAQRSRLSLMWGSPTPAFALAEGDLKDAPVALPSFEQIVQQIQQSPDLGRWTAEFAQREAALAVQRAKAVPDLSVSAGYRRFTEVDANAFLVGATVTLPFFDRNRGGIQEAESRVAKAHEEKRATESRVLAALAEAYAVMAGAYDEVTTLRSAVLPGSQQAFEAVSEGYRLGRFGYADVIESQRTLVTARTQHLAALASYHKAVASVERLTGAPLPDRAPQSQP